MRKLVIIPTYNEIENISAMIDKVFSLEEQFDLLIIDDGSPDGTTAVVKKRMVEFPERLFIIERSGKL
ncbi:MAG: glycosyltransferase, partial [Alistipes sp.]|nr:glycosyltransferase [Alistipes sp.]